MPELKCESCGAVLELTHVENGTVLCSCGAVNVVPITVSSQESIQEEKPAAITSDDDNGSRYDRRRFLSYVAYGGAIILASILIVGLIVVIVSPGANHSQAPSTPCGITKAAIQSVWRAPFINGTYAGSAAVPSVSLTPNAFGKTALNDDITVIFFSTRDPFSDSYYNMYYFVFNGAVYYTGC